MSSNFVTFSVSFLNGRIVGVFVTHEECSFYVTTVRVFPSTVKHFLVQFNVVVVDRVIKSYSYHLGYVFSRQISWNGSSIFGAEAVRQHAHDGIARGSSIRIIIDI